MVLEKEALSPSVSLSNEGALLSQTTDDAAVEHVAMNCSETLAPAAEEDTSPKVAYNSSDVHNYSPSKQRVRTNPIMGEETLLGALCTWIVDHQIG